METPLNSGDDVSKSQKLWLSRISKEESTHKDWRDHCADVEEIFRVDGEDIYVPLYWSVVGVEHVGVYSNQPVADVRPSNQSKNPLFISVARMVQRGLTKCIDHPSFDESMHRSVDDFLAMSLGVVRIKLDSIINTTRNIVPIFGTDAMGQPVQVGSRPEDIEEIGEQTLRWEYVPWRRFGWEPCNNWKHCSWIYFRHRMTQLQIKKRFGKTVKASKDQNDRVTTNEWKAKTFDIYEVWDKDKKRVLFIAKGEEEPIEVMEDPLGLIEFWPIPQPMMTNLPSEELIPQPDYDYIRFYDSELNRLHERRASLTEQIKAAGAFDIGMPELSDMLELEDGEMKGVQNLMQRINAAGGVDGIMYFLPIAEKVEALRVVTEQIQIVKSQVDEMLGISDIVRGVTAASETATAQEIKGRWVGVRLTRKRETVIYTVKSMLRIMAQLLVSHITPQNLQRMTQMDISEEMMQVLKNDMMMEFSIDIETDSTVAKDEFKERETFQEMLNGVAQFAQSVLPMVQQNALPADVSSAVLSAALKPYAKYDRNLEEALSSLPQTQQQLQELNQQLQQTQQQLTESQQQAQQWQSAATLLQQQSTEAGSKQKTADAEKKKAETREIMQGLEDGKIQPLKTVAEIGNIEAQTDVYKKTNPNSGGRNG
jgi:hypothetical protein